MNKDVLIAQITDTHIVAKDKHWMGLSRSNTAQRLEVVVEHINCLTPRPDIVIHSGDISDEGDIDSYLQAKELLEKLEIKYYLTCGNHDNFSNLKKVFTQHDYFLSDRFSHYVIEDLPIRLIVLDSQVIDKAYGMLCSARIEWLKKILLTSIKHTLIFIHHFPIKVKDEVFNKINLLNNNALESIVSQHDNILGIFCGHSHYGAAGIYSGKFCWVSPSTAPIHTIKNNRCVGLTLSSPSFSLHKYCSSGKITSSVVTVDGEIDLPQIK
ncbi:MAG: metallophosphoesterase [Proteobacteria bacterium]|nr:metallophosphoesterase [Pseudomonadota bacterium]